MRERVVKFLTRYNMLPRPARVGVAVSGGADSVCLLHLLAELADELEISLAILHVNHGLRGQESDGDAAFVAALAAGLRVPFYAYDGPAGPGSNVEQSAREIRLEFFQRAIRERGLDRVATAHTRDDQAETVLFRFLRGSGGAGLSGIRPVTSEGLIRPLLEIDRAEIESWLRERRIPWRNDSSNGSMEFARNRIRHSLLPELEREWNPALRDTLVRTAEWAAAEETYWDAEVSRLAAERFTVEPGGAVLVRAGAFCDVPLAVGRRLVRRAIEMVKGDLRSVAFDHVEAVLGLTQGREGHARTQVPGVDVLRSFDWLRFGGLGEYTLEDRNYEASVAAPGVTEIKQINLCLVMELVCQDDAQETVLRSSRVYNSEGDRLDCDRLSADLVLRNWRPGDQYRPFSATRPEKIKTLFQSARIPIWERRHWPVLLSGSQIVWSRRFGVAAEFAARPESVRVWLVRESKQAVSASIVVSR